MHRRDFLKGIAGGVTVAALPMTINLADLAELPESAWQPVTLVGGYREDVDEYWLRVSVVHDGREWHDVVQFTGASGVDKEPDVLAVTVNAVMARSGLPYVITGQAVLEAFA